MSPKRLTRQESQARTRTKLLEAAARVFAAKGFAGATVEDISYQAGFTRGAFYSNFADKDELLLALLDEYQQERSEQLAPLLFDADTPADFFESVRTFNTRLGREAQQWFMLRMEFYLYALRNPRMRSAVVRREREGRTELAVAIEHLFNQLGVPLPAPLGQLSALVDGLNAGLLLKHYLDPQDVPEGLIFDLLGLLMQAVADQTGTGGDDSSAARASA